MSWCAPHRLSRPCSKLVHSGSRTNVRCCMRPWMSACCIRSSTRHIFNIENYTTQV